MIFLSPSRHIPGYILKSWHNCIHLNPFHVIIHLSHFIWRYIVLVTESVVK
jgi:hypothetical protein